MLRKLGVGDIICFLFLTDIVFLAWFFLCHSEFVTLTHINMYLGFFFFFFFFGEKVYIGFLTLMILILIYCFLCRHIHVRGMNMSLMYSENIL